MMMAHVELLSFWHSLQQLQSSEELGVKVEKFASRAFDDLVSAELFALEDSPGNPRVLRACGGLSSGDTTLLGKSGYSAAITAGDAVNIPAAAPDYHGKLIVPLYTQSLPAGERHRRGSNRSQVSEKGSEASVATACSGGSNGSGGAGAIGAHSSSEDAAAAARAEAAAAAAASLNGSMIRPSSACSSQPDDAGDANDELRPIGLLVLTRAQDAPAAPSAAERISAPFRVRREKRPSQAESDKSGDSFESHSPSRASLSASLSPRTSRLSANAGNSVDPFAADPPITRRSFNASSPVVLRRASENEKVRNGASLSASAADEQRLRRMSDPIVSSSGGGINDEKRMSDPSARADAAAAAAAALGAPSPSSVLSSSANTPAQVLQSRPSGGGGGVFNFGGSRKVRRNSKTEGGTLEGSIIDGVPTTAASELFTRSERRLISHIAAYVGGSLQRALESEAEHSLLYSADSVLGDMLPDHIAQQLKQRIKTSAAKEREFLVEHSERVAVLFSEVVGFEEFCNESSGPLEVVRVLNTMFAAFDALLQKHSVYKVETVGSVYMAATGLPFLTPKTFPEGDLLAMANDMIAVMDALYTTLTSGEERRFQIRIGLHVGPVLAGVVGLELPRYCLFGDTVNTAARMQTTGLPNRIQVSESFKGALEAEVGATVIGGGSHRFNLSDRGLMPVKGKGEMRTFLVEQVRRRRSSIIGTGGINDMVQENLKRAGLLTRFVQIRQSRGQRLSSESVQGSSVQGRRRRSSASATMFIPHDEKEGNNTSPVPSSAADSSSPEKSRHGSSFHGGSSSHGGSSFILGGRRRSSERRGSGDHTDTLGNSQHGGSPGPNDRTRSGILPSPLAMLRREGSSGTTYDPSSRRGSGMSHTSEGSPDERSPTQGGESNGSRHNGSSMSQLLLERMTGMRRSHGSPPRRSQTMDASSHGSLDGSLHTRSSGSNSPLRLGSPARTGSPAALN